jgi:hypothetical protein
MEPPLVIITCTLICHRNLKILLNYPTSMHVLNCENDIQDLK